MQKMTFKTPLAIAIAAASLGISGVATAQTSMEQRFAELEARIEAAEQRADAAERRAEVAEQSQATSAAPESDAEIEERLARVERYADGEEGFSFNVYARSGLLMGEDGKSENAGPYLTPAGGEIWRRGTFR